MDTVEKYINRFPAELADLAVAIRRIILDAHPCMTERLSYGIPFFYCGTWVCYLNLTKDFRLELGFCKGHLLHDPEGRLLAKGRKLVRSLQFQSLDDIDEQELNEFLGQAVKLNRSRLEQQGL